MISAPVLYGPDVEHEEPRESEAHGDVETTVERTAEDYGRAVHSVRAKSHAPSRLSQAA